MDPEGTQHLLRKLHKVFKDGYRPARGNESYNTMLKNGEFAYSLVNCFGHIFNLKNQQFDDYQIKPYKIYGYFPGASLEDNDAITQRMLDFVKETGLKIEECAPNAKIKDFKSWKVALYFVDYEGFRDFHYLLQETPQRWSNKIGFRPFVEYVYDKKPPKKYQNLIDNKPPIYELHATYKITNPNANENNRYVQDLTR